MRARSPATGNRAAVPRRRPHAILGNASGAALITTVIILLLLGALGAALGGMVNTHLSNVMLEVDRLQAVYLAEAGLARASYEMAKDRDLFGGDGVGTIPVTAFGPGYFWVTKEPEARVLRGVGVVRDVHRVLANRY